MIRAFAATEAGGEMKPYEYDPGALPADEVEIRVESCGICHSDLSMLNNDWGNASFPFVGGHEVSGIVEAAGDQVGHLKAGDRVGLGWFSRSCLTCQHCMSGDHNHCGDREDMIAVRPGGFGERVRCQAAWAVKIPEGVDPSTAGPLFCGGITVFNPIVQFGVCPTDRVGVIGIGGLGHLAVQFLAKWGCEVTAFTSSDAKAQEAHELGAHRAVNSRNSSALEAEQGRFDFIISTVNVPLDWDAYFAVLAQKGRLHHVGAVLEPVPVPAFTLIAGQKSMSGTPLGSPATMATMLEFCARHNIAPKCETFPMSKINDALEHLRRGKPHYRIVLESDFD